MQNDLNALNAKTGDADTGSTVVQAAHNLQVASDAARSGATGVVALQEGVRRIDELRDVAGVFEEYLTCEVTCQTA